MKGNAKGAEMKRIYLTIAALALSVTVAQAASGNGGLLYAHAQRACSAPRITGMCASACTTVLMCKNVCAMPGAELGFHAVIGTKHNARINAWVMGLYPPRVRAYIRAHGGLTSRKIIVNASRLVRGC